MGHLTDRLVEALEALEVAAAPRRVADGALLLEAVQKHEQRTKQLEAQVLAFVAGGSPEPVDDHKPLAEWAYEVLRDSAGPMRYREIAAEIRGRGFRHARQPKSGDAQLADSVWSAMYEDPRKRFVKVGRGIWDLSERTRPSGD
jgi:hypothetical protein